jgi:membrane dipeptidase
MLSAHVAPAALWILAAVGLSCLSCSPDPARVHREAIVCDMHCDTLMRVLNGYRLADRHVEGHVDLPRLAEGGIDLEFFACWPSPDLLSKGQGDPDSSAHRVRTMIDAFYRELEANPDRMGIALSATQARDVIAHGKIAAALGVEGGHAIEDSLEILQEFYDKGVRYMTLTWNNSPNWADAALEATEGNAVHGGLTELGREVVEMMNCLGMMVDVSHVSEATFWDVMEVTEDPIIASHSCAYALCPHYRNLKDDQLRAVAANDGVVCVNFYAGYLDSTYARAMDQVPKTYKAEFDSLADLYGSDRDLLWQARRQIYSRVTAGIQVPLEEIADHVDYIAHVAGIDHVGLGSDFDGISRPPDGLDDASDFPKITTTLLQRGYKPAEVKKILGGNVMRVFERVCG